jgi:hypothetical protein
VLNRAQAAVERRCDDGEERRRLELGTNAKEGERELKSEGDRCGELRGVEVTFMVVGRAPRWRQRAVSGGINAIDGRWRL